MDKGQIKADIQNIGKQMEGAAKAFNTPKWMLYIVGALAMMRAVTLLLRIIN